MQGVRIHATGIVQGVGFRPFVWRTATSLGLSGWVCNAEDGVHAEAFGPPPALDAFVEALRLDCPDAARVDGVRAEPIDAPDPGPGFSIVESDQGGSRSTLVSPDIATCPECLRELFDEGDRRYHYPFINCTNCGPRFTVIADLPYDRRATSMARFEMCPSCSREYADPSDRRFHAQPDACFECGPHLFWRAADDPETVLHGRDLRSSDEVIEKAASLLLDGGIVAVKGLGGFHLACDATNEEAVERLRERKRRPTKPLAVMFGGIDDLRAELDANDEERSLLEGTVRPIVLLRRKPARGAAPHRRLAQAVAGDLPEIGAMLPYTPLQHLLLSRVGRPLVMTSGNLSDEPILTDDGECLERLSGVADAWVGNDRPILARYDDSVARVSGGCVQVVRRARGMAPAPIDLPATGGGVQAPCVLACGPEQKATFCFARGDLAFVSQHIGDLENADAFDAWEDGVARYRSLFGVEEGAIACDMHPDYLASKWARSRARRLGLPLVEVQHHHAHIAATMGENGAAGPLVGIALDGTGYGPDGTVWGGEVLVCDQGGYERAAHLSTWPLPGGAAAIRRPARCAAGLLQAYGLAGHEGARALYGRMGAEAPLVARMVERGVNCPQTSSAGRLFDAAAALLGLVDVAGYDGEPACLLEALALAAPAGSGGEDRYLPLLRPARDGEQADPRDGSLVVDVAPTIAAVLDDLLDGVDPALIALRFHLGLADGFCAAAGGAARERGLASIALGGGVFMNRIVSGRVRERLGREGFTVLMPRKLPVNDGGVAYGQAVVARARLASGPEPRVSRAPATDRRQG